jgi:hypothetical protein
MRRSTCLEGLARKLKLPEDRDAIALGRAKKTSLAEYTTSFYPLIRAISA